MEINNKIKLRTKSVKVKIRRIKSHRDRNTPKGK